MAHFWMWMACLFTMAVFWKFMSSWSTWKSKDFLQVQREYCQKINNDILRLENCLKDMEASLKTKILNKNQCLHLFGKLILAMKGINEMLSSTTKDLKFQSIFEELYRLQRKIEIVGKNCIEQEQWHHSAIFQLQNKETFRELLLDLKCCYDTASDIYLFFHPNQSNNILTIQFDAATYAQVFEDGQVLKKKLEHISQEEVSLDYEIVQHLLLRLRNLDRVNGGDLDDLEIPNNFKIPKLIKEIGAGNFGHVYKSNWLGLVCATKVLEGDHEFLKTSRKEVGILAGLSHPNLVQFFGCGINKKPHQNVHKNEIAKMHLVELKKSTLSQILENLIQYFGCKINKKLHQSIQENESGEVHLVMEMMESSLSQILKKIKRPLPYHLAIDIMHQIAKGVYYLHDMQVAHLDLKPDNVLSSSIPIKDLDPHHIFKITDYGASELEVCMNPKNPEPSKYTIGTQGYMAPEMIKENKAPLYRFQADVWSFAMMCSEILSGKVPYWGLEFNDFCDQISRTHANNTKNLRPDLPNNCNELTNLIQDCWSQDPLQRPIFSEICRRLESLKKSFWKGTYSYNMVPEFGSPCTLQDSKSTITHVPKVDKPIAPAKEILVDLDHQLSKAKRLLKLNYIGIVGMGGIGKTTLAKAIFNDVTMNSSYHISCFVANCKNYQRSFEILCKILSKFGNDQKPKNLGDAQKMMKELLVGKKILLILDDIKDEAQVHDIVPSNFVQASKGTTIILTTRKWSSIKSFVGIEGKLDVELLDEKAATTLFTTHLSWGEAPFSLDFEDLCKHVVKACNGLPLSLKVMGAFLHNKKRLRSWERALQRMARGKNLDGDEEIWNTLQISYDGLNNDVEKGIFLDVACFFCRDVYPSGISKEMILSIWSKDGKFPKIELERLIDMSLLKINEDGDILEMHDQLRDMGRMIAKDTRIWRASMIPENEFTSKNIEVLEGISWKGTIVKPYHNFDFKKLRVLIFVVSLGNLEAYVNNLDFLLSLASQCSNLEAIIIENSQNSIILPHTLPEKTISALQKRISNLCGTCSSLKILDLMGLGFLEQLPNNFASSYTLLRLNLGFCYSLVALPKEVENLSSLSTLYLGGCSKLEALPKEVGNLSSLTILNLEECLSLQALPKEMGNLSLLNTLNLRSCSSLEVLPNEVGNFSFLTTLDLRWCSRLANLPKEIGNLSSLTTLLLEECSRLEALPKEVGNLSSLTTLNLRRCLRLEALPNEIGNLSSLITLNLRRCSRLEALPNEIGNLSSLITLNLSQCSRLQALPKEVGNLFSLTNLHLWQCSSLGSLPKEVGSLSSLIILDLDGCSKLEALPMEVGNLSSLTTLDLNKCSRLDDLPMEMRNLSSLTTLNLWQCSKLKALPTKVGYLSSLIILNLWQCSKLEALPKEVGNLSSLTTLDLEDCLKLEALPKEIGNLSSLTTLNLRECSSLKSLPKEVKNLSSLTTLYLNGCSSLEALPKEIGNLASLTTLDLRECSSLEALPKEVGNLSSLTTLDLRKCLCLDSLPKEVGNLSSLTTLYLNGCSSLEALPKEVENLSSLTTLDLRECSSLEALPKEVGNLSSLTTLNLRKCSHLAALPKEVMNLSSLTPLDLKDHLRLKVMPNKVKNLSSLTTLDLEEYSHLEVLLKENRNLSYLTTLNLRKCSHLEALPKEVENLSSLTTLHLWKCLSLKVLPKEVENLSSLTTLHLWKCPSLEALPKEVGNLSSLTTLNLECCSRLKALPREIGNLSFLTILDLEECSRIEALPKEVGNLSSLITLNLRKCSNLESLPKEIGNLLSLTTFNLGGCLRLEALPKEVGNLSSLITLNLRCCLNLEALPKEVGNLSSLTTFNLRWCSRLESFPKEIGNLSSLNTLNLGGCLSLEILPKEVGNLSSLTTLNLKCCSRLEALPKEVGNLSSLKTFDLECCSRLGALPKEVGNLSSLTTLNLRECSSLEALPKEVEKLFFLTTLHLGGCSRLEA